MSENTNFIQPADGDLILPNDSTAAAASSTDGDGGALWGAPVVADYHRATATPVAEDGAEKEVQAETQASEIGDASQGGVGDGRGGGGGSSGR